MDNPFDVCVCCCRHEPFGATYKIYCELDKNRLCHGVNNYEYYDKIMYRSIFCSSHSDELCLGEEASHSRTNFIALRCLDYCHTVSDAICSIIWIWMVLQTKKSVLYQWRIHSSKSKYIKFDAIYFYNRGHTYQFIRSKLKSSLIFALNLNQPHIRSMQFVQTES